jgi:Clp amino terminal domain, pathogenicity island component
VESREQLIDEVRDRAGDDPLDRVEVAAALAGELAERGDRVVDEFIAAARQAGVSWTEIGTRLGVSKQAARQRFADRIPVAGFEDRLSLRPRLRACLARADTIAQDEGADEVGTHHLLAGLLAEGVAAAILEHLGVTADAIRSSATRLFGPTTPAGDARPPARSVEAASAIESAARHAQMGAGPSGCLEVGTEHLLFVLVMDPGSRARRVLVDLDIDIAVIKAIKKELACYVQGNSRPTRRSRRTRRTRSA